VIAGWVGINAMFYTVLALSQPTPSYPPYRTQGFDAYTMCLQDQSTLDLAYPAETDFPGDVRMEAIRIQSAMSASADACEFLLPPNDGRDVHFVEQGAPSRPDPVIL
jgi:hypothetical protein